MREWTEKHIRELVRRHSKGGKGELETALLLRLWITNLNTDPIPIINGSGSITFKLVRPTVTDNLAQYGRTVVLVEFEGMDFSDDHHNFFLAEAQAHHRAELTVNTVAGKPDYWLNVIKAMFYRAVVYNTFWTTSALQSSEVYCDEVAVKGATYSVSRHHVYDNPDRNNVSFSDVLGDVVFRNIPAGTKKVSVFYEI